MGNNKNKKDTKSNPVMKPNPAIKRTTVSEGDEFKSGQRNVSLKTDLTPKTLFLKEFNLEDTDGT